MNIDFVATGRISNSNDVMRLESSFELQDMSTTTINTYVCGEESSEEGFFKIEKADTDMAHIVSTVSVF
ncbi:MAG: hypothetical protein ACFWTJ_04195 [Lachnoclostridium sp.]|jgi:hypothetical protein